MRIKKISSKCLSLINHRAKNSFSIGKTRIYSKMFSILQIIHDASFIATVYSFKCKKIIIGFYIDFEPMLSVDQGLFTCTSILLVARNDSKK